FGINPYTIGFKMLQDIRRICEKPTDEDRAWFPNIVNTNWVETLNSVMNNFKDESFVAQFLSPHLIRDLKLFSIIDDDLNSELIVSSIHDESGYQHIRQTLSDHYNLSYTEPDIQVYKVDHRGDRSLTLRHIQQDRLPLHEDMKFVMKYM